MITSEQLDKLKSHLDLAYQNQDFKDHNFPTPVEIVNFVEQISKSKTILAERNIEWLLSNKVKYFLSDCIRKQDVLKFLQNKMNLKTIKIGSDQLNSVSSEMDYKNISLRTNYPFNDESTGNLKATIWPELLQKDWERGYKDITCIVGSAWGLADTSNTGKTNLLARQFILPKLNWFVWNDSELFKPHAKVSTATINISKDSKPIFEVYNKNFQLEYKGDKRIDDYIFRTSLVRDLVNLQKKVFGNDYYRSNYDFHRNQFPIASSKKVKTFSINKDGLPTNEKLVDYIDKDHGEKFRLGVPDTRNSTQGRSWFSTIAIYKPEETVKKNYTMWSGTEENCENLKSLLQTKTASILFEDNWYSRTFTGPTTKFIGQFPLSEKWNDDKILKYINGSHLRDAIEKRYDEGFNNGQ